MWSVQGSSTSWYVLVKNGAATGFAWCELSIDTTISPHRSTRKAMDGLRC
uniref:Uncharacterized protein n=1 Tax=Arundo donax TaxID=35708 RepID=A0A0A9E6I5_ARUDO